MLLFKVGAVYLSITIMIFIPYTCLYLQYTDIYGCKYNKKKWDWQTFKSFFLTFCIFHENDVRSRLQMTQIHPFFILAHKCFFLKKVSKYHCLQINYWYITICKMTLPNMFTKKYHRSIIISIEVSSNHHKALYKNTKL